MASMKPDMPNSAPPHAEPPALLPDDLRLLASPGLELPIVQRIAGARGVLRSQARALTSADSLETLERRMRATLDQAKGVGLAAPQIGISVRSILVMLGAREANPHVQLFVNPRIVERTDTLTLDYEGCLSITGVCGRARRSRVRSRG